MDCRSTNNFEQNEDLVMQVVANQTIEELESNRRNVAGYLTALVRTMNSLNENVQGNDMMTIVKIVHGLSDAVSFYAMYTRAMQLKA